MEKHKTMSMTQREEALFERWAQKEGRGNRLVRDGAPCPEQFEREKIKITFVLKEAYDFDYPSEEYRDMREWIGDGAIARTWNNIARWTQAILEGGDFPQAVSQDYRARWLKKISFMNIKKVSGGASVSNYADIDRFAEDDAELLLAQLGIYQPDLIVCGGIDTVADSLAKHVFHYDGEWQHDEENHKICWFYGQLPARPGKTAVLNYYHPVNLGSKLTNQALFDKMAQASRHALEG